MQENLRNTLWLQNVHLYVDQNVAYRLNRSWNVKLSCITVYIYLFSSSNYK